MYSWRMLILVAKDSGCQQNFVDIRPLILQVYMSTLVNDKFYVSLVIKFSQILIHLWLQIVSRTLILHEGNAALEVKMKSTS